MFYQDTNPELGEVLNEDSMLGEIMFGDKWRFKIHLVTLALIIPCPASNLSEIISYSLLYFKSRDPMSNRSRVL